jgi:uncharacterized cupredoxin-like copper-binding protein
LAVERIRDCAKKASVAPLFGEERRELKQMRRWIVAVASVLAVAVGVSAAWGAANKTVVRVTLKEFKVIPTPTSAPRGAVAFSVRNTGKLEHELVVLKTNVAPAKLPVKGSKAVEVGRVGKVVVKPGKAGGLTLALKAGKYVLLCNFPGHYQAGQRIGFVVR